MEVRGAVDYECPLCKTVLLERLERGQARNIVVKCPLCGTASEPPE
jgi:predicted RNA-binding Zn-ribbon protein involved in translation (DUF1610 family)